MFNQHFSGYLAGLAVFFSVMAMTGGAGCKHLPDAKSVLEVVDDACVVVDLLHVDPRATEVCVIERQVADVLRVLLGKQVGMPAPFVGAAGSPPERTVLVRLPAGKTGADLQRGR